MKSSLGYNHSAICKKHLAHLITDMPGYSDPIYKKKYVYRCVCCGGTTDHLPVLVKHLKVAHGRLQDPTLFKTLKHIAEIIRENNLPLECLGQK